MNFAYEKQFPLSRRKLAAVNEFCKGEMRVSIRRYSWRKYGMVARECGAVLDAAEFQTLSENIETIKEQLSTVGEVIIASIDRQLAIRVRKHDGESFVELKTEHSVLLNSSEWDAFIAHMGAISAAL